MTLRTKILTRRQFQQRLGLILRVLTLHIIRQQRLEIHRPPKLAEQTGKTPKPAIQYILIRHIILNSVDRIFSFISIS